MDATGHRIDRLDAEHFVAGAVDRNRLAACLQLPGPEAIDEATASFLSECEERREQLLSPWISAAVFRIGRIGERHMELEGGRSLEATRAYCRKLVKTQSDQLVIASFTLGGSIDRRVTGYLNSEHLFEAFVMKQWANVVVEQIRSWVTRTLCDWADSGGRSLIPYDGPGYNGWNLLILHELQALLVEAGASDLEDHVKVNSSGMITPANSMMIVYAASQKETLMSVDDSLAQCARCGMKDCSFRIAPPEPKEAAELATLADIADWK